jgi:predicted dehydrogenase
MAGPLGVGVIGCGNISTTYFRLARLFRGIEMRACADLDMTVAQARAREFGLKAQSVKDLLSDDTIGIVVNLTIPATHFKVTRAILEAGKHAYSEKPLALTLAEARALQKIAARKRLKIGCAPDTFLGGAQQRARKAVDEGAIGRIASGSAHIMGRGMEHWHPNPDFFFKPGGGPVLDMGPYYIVALVNLIGPVRRVAALSGMARKVRVIESAPRRGEKIAVRTPTTVLALLEFASGAQVTLSASWDVYAHRHPNLEIYGSEGALFLPDPNFFGGTVEVTGTDGVVRPLPDWNHCLGIANEAHGSRMQANYRAAGLADMADAIARKRDIRCSLERALHTVDVMTSILKSGETGRFITLASTCTRPRPLSPEEAAALMHA